jgi:hypothetical protein
VAFGADRGWRLMRGGWCVQAQNDTEHIVFKTNLTEYQAEMWRWRFNKQGYRIVAVMRGRGREVDA